MIRKKETLKFIKRNIIKIMPIAIFLIYIVVFHFIVTGSDKPVFGGTGEAKGLTIIGFLEKNFVWDVCWKFDYKYSCFNNWSNIYNSEYSIF